jgi:hypothetical protein
MAKSGIALHNSHDDWPSVIKSTVSEYHATLPSYQDGDITALQTDNKGRLLVSFDDELHTRQHARAQLDNKRFKIQQKTNVEIARINKTSEAQVASLRYDFLSTLVRWSIAGMTILAAVGFMT